MRAKGLQNPRFLSASLLSFLAPRPNPYLAPKPSESFESPSMASTLEEPNVGIHCYVSSLPGFRGILKQRYSDFIVHEVDQDGKIVHLTSFNPPPEFAEDQAKGDALSIDCDYSKEIEMFRSLTSDADVESLDILLKSIASGPASNVAPILLSQDPDKSHRAEVHNFFKHNFKFLVTDTVEGSGSKCVRVRYSSGKVGTISRGVKRKERGGSGSRDEKAFDSRGSEHWPENLGKFLRFHLYKENKDTQEALGVIGKMLGVQQRSFGFSGTKDKRAVSTQRVTVFKQQANKLAALNSRLIGIKVGDFCYVKEGLVLGQLQGNRFTVTLRGVVAESQDTVKAAADGLGRNGFINYYGLQRFGSGSVPTHLIGAVLLKGEWKSAVELLLNPREGERPFIRHAREQYKENGDIDLALKQFPRHLVAERAILQCMKRCPGNYLQALRAIPRTLRMMYVHSYQSFLWNHAASMRVQKHGIDQVVLGDLVYCKESSSKTGLDNAKPEVGIDLDDDNLPCEMPDAAITEEQVHFVKVVSSEDLLGGRYTFDDVVLPLPGSTILYPANDIASTYHVMAMEDGISLTESAHGVKEFSITDMKGGYRRIFQRPIDFVWELLSYTDDTMPLVDTDLDVISKTKSAEMMTKGIINGIGKSGHQSEKVENVTEDGSKSSETAESVCNSGAQSPKMALKLEFTLPASCYATMAIRELLKTSTSVAYQKTIDH